MNQENENITSQSKGPPSGASAAPSVPAPWVELWPFRQLLSSSWKYYLALLKRIWPLILGLPVLFLAFLVPLILVSVFASITGIKMLYLLLVPLFIVFPVAAFVYVFILNIVPFLVLHELYEQRQPKLRDAIKKSLKLVIPYLVVSLFLGLIISGGFIFLIVPGIIVAVWLGVSVPVTVLEGKRGFGALYRSTGLVRGHTSQVFLRFLGFGLAAGAVAIGSGILVFLAGTPAVSFFIKLFLGSESSPISDILGGILGGLVIAYIWVNIALFLIGFFADAFVYLLYRNLKEIKGEVEDKGKKVLFIIFLIVGIPVMIWSAASDFSRDRDKDALDRLRPGGASNSLEVEVLGPGEGEVGAYSKEANDRDLRRSIDLVKIATVLMVYHRSNNSYPNTDNNLVKISEICPTLSLSDCPKDPLEERYYGYRSDGRGFEITSVMEDPECAPDESKNGYDITMGKEGNYCLYKIKKSK